MTITIATVCNRAMKEPLERADIAKRAMGVLRVMYLFPLPLTHIVAKPCAKVIQCTVERDLQGVGTTFEVGGEYVIAPDHAKMCGTPSPSPTISIVPSNPGSWIVADVCGSDFRIRYVL